MFWQQLDFLLNGLFITVGPEDSKGNSIFSVHLRSASSEGT